MIRPLSLAVKPTVRNRLIATQGNVASGADA